MVLITKWQLVRVTGHSDHSNYLEITAFTATQDLEKLVHSFYLEDVTIPDVLPLVAQLDNDTLNLCGLVLVKSALLYNEHHAFFVLQLEVSQGYSGFRAFVFCKAPIADALPLAFCYESTKVNHRYLFTNLEPSKMRFQATEDPVAGLGFNFAKSRIFNDQNRDSNISEKLLSQLDLGSQTQVSQGCNAVYDYGIISYTGTITDIIDHNAGIYEIDHLHHLFLTYYPLRNSGLGLRAGAVIELMNLHLISYIPFSKTYFLACTSTTLVITTFSPLNNSCILENVKSKGKLLRTWKGLNFIDILNKMQIEARFKKLKAHFDDIITEKGVCLEILEKLGYTPFTWTQHHGILKHSDCRLAALRYPPFQLSTILDLHHLQSPGKLETGTWNSTSCKSSGIFEISSVLIFMLSTDEFGQLEAVDETGSMKVCITGDFDISLIGRLCLLKAFEVCYEQHEESRYNDAFTYVKIVPMNLFAVSTLPASLPPPKIFYFIPSSIHPVSLHVQDEVLVHQIIEGHMIANLENMFNSPTLYMRLSKRSMCFSGAFIAGSVFKISSYTLPTLICDNSYIFESVDSPILLEQVNDHSSVFSEWKSDNLVEHRFRSVVGALAFGKTCGGGKTHLINLQARIISKSITKHGQEMESRLYPLLVEKQQMGGSLVLATHYFTLALQDDNSSTNLMIELKSKAIIFPLNMIPGEIVQFKNLGLYKAKSGEVLAKILATTQTKIVDKYQLWHENTVEQVSDVRYLAEALTSNPVERQELRCSLSTLLNLSARYECNRCSSTLVSQTCPNKCLNVEPGFEVTCVFSADDGTHEICLLFSDYNSIFKILQMTPIEISQLRTWAADGLVKYSVMPDDSKLLQEALVWFKNICGTDAWKRQIRVVGGFTKFHIGAFCASSPFSLLSADLFRTRSFKDLEGKMHSVGAIKSVRFKVNSFQEIDPIFEAYKLLSFIKH